MKLDVSVNKLDYIDATRGIAILMVILVHTSQLVNDLPWIVKLISSYGQMGVQLFFVASALTLCISHARRSNERGSNLNYFIRRFFRIAPLYYCGIVGFFALNYIGTKYLGIAYIKENQYTLTNVLSNIFLIHGTVPSANNNIVPGGWSIGTEFIFYVIFPLLFPLLSWVNKKLSIIGLVLILSFASISNFAFQELITINSTLGFKNNSFWYFNITNNIPVFLSGFILFYVMHKAKMSKVVSLSIFLILSAFSLYLFNGNADITFSIIPLISGLSFVFLIQGIRSMTSTPYILRRIGQLSYAMYITHIVFTSYIMRAIDKHVSFDSSILKLVIYYAVVVTLASCSAMACEKIIESPGIMLGKKLIARLNKPRVAGNAF